MNVLTVVEWPAEVLKTKSKDVASFDEQLRQFVASMHATMDAAGGIGLAANQVGMATRVITIRIPWVEEDSGTEKREWWHDKRFTFVNPVIEKKSGRIRWQEGCLSFPEIFDFVDRAAEISVRALDEHGKEFQISANGLMSVCLQHEIDHIDGIVFIDRMSRLKSSLIRKKMMRRGTFDGDEASEI
jgi:peptide deformylase